MLKEWEKSEKPSEEEIKARLEAVKEKLARQQPWASALSLCRILHPCTNCHHLYENRNQNNFVCRCISSSAHQHQSALPSFALLFHASTALSSFLYCAVMHPQQLHTTSILNPSPNRGYLNEISTSVLPQNGHGLSSIIIHPPYNFSN